MPEAERDPIEWAQHSALVAISVARSVLDLVEAVVTDRDRLERLAGSGRSFAESWVGDAVRLAGSMAAGFGFEPDRPPTTPPPEPTTAELAAAAKPKRTRRKAAIPASP